MRNGFLFAFLTLFIRQHTFSQSKVFLSSGYDDAVRGQLKPYFEVPSGQMEDLLKGKVIAEGEVKTLEPNMQQLMLFVSGIHPRNCKRAMRKLSLYEQYSQYMDFVKQSSYDEKAKKISLTIDHALLPFPMLVKFKIPRIQGEGSYPFVFEDGFLKDLKGTVVVRPIGKYCLMGLKTDWKGPETKIPNMVFSTFLETVGKLGLEHLIRVSIF
jgi:hypothetical protein